MPKIKKQYKDHDVIIKEIGSLVSSNFEFSSDHMHAREILDDIIHDLNMYRDTLASPDQYMKKYKMDTTLMGRMAVNNSVVK